MVGLLSLQQAQGVGVVVANVVEDAGAVHELVVVLVLAVQSLMGVHGLLGVVGGGLEVVQCEGEVFAVSLLRPQLPGRCEGHGEQLQEMLLGLLKVLVRGIVLRPFEHTFRFVARLLQFLLRHFLGTCHDTLHALEVVHLLVAGVQHFQASFKRLFGGGYHVGGALKCCGCIAPLLGEVVAAAQLEVEARQAFGSVGHLLGQGYGLLQHRDGLGIVLRIGKTDGVVAQGGDVLFGAFAQKLFTQLHGAGCGLECGLRAVGAEIGQAQRVPALGGLAGLCAARGLVGCASLAEEGLGFCEFSRIEQRVGAGLQGFGALRLLGVEREYCRKGKERKKESFHSNKVFSNHFFLAASPYYI